MREASDSGTSNRNRQLTLLLYPNRSNPEMSIELVYFNIYAKRKRKQSSIFTFKFQ